MGTQLNSQVDGSVMSCGLSSMICSGIRNICITCYFKSSTLCSTITLNILKSRTICCKAGRGRVVWDSPERNPDT